MRERLSEREIESDIERGGGERERESEGGRERKGGVREGSR